MSDLTGNKYWPHDLMADHDHCKRDLAKAVEGLRNAVGAIDHEERDIRQGRATILRGIADRLAGDAERGRRVLSDLEGKGDNADPPVYDFGWRGK